jgi:hypothetical protein
VLNNFGSGQWQVAKKGKREKKSISRAKYNQYIQANLNDINFTFLREKDMLMF